MRTTKQTANGLLNTTGQTMPRRIGIAIDHTGRRVVIHRNAQLGEYRVCFYQDGTHQQDADYFTSDQADAYGTANVWVNQSPDRQAKASVDGTA